MNLRRRRKDGGLPDGDASAGGTAAVRPETAGGQAQGSPGGNRRADTLAAVRRWSGRASGRGLAAAVLAAVLLAAGATAMRPSPVVHAQGVNPAGHTITVMGTDRQSVAPDRAEVSLGVATSAATASASQNDNSKTSAAVIAALASSGVAAGDIRTAEYTLSPRYRQPGPGKPEQISGFETTHILSVTVRDIKQVGAVIDAAVAAGANRIQGVDYTVSDRSKIQLQSYAGAVKDARARADAIASALGVQVSGAYAVDATNSTWTGPVPFSAVAAPAATVAAPIQPGRQTVETQVKVVFSFS